MSQKSLSTNIYLYIMLKLGLGYSTCMTASSRFNASDLLMLVAPHAHTGTIPVDV
jgi:hypothetical protein